MSTLIRNWGLSMLCQTVACSEQGSCGLKTEANIRPLGKALIYQGGREENLRSVKIVDSGADANRLTR